MDREYARQYEELYQRHWWWRCRESLILRVLERMSREESLPADRQILDVGCGNGLFFDKLQRFGNVAGIEPDEKLVDPDGPHAGQIHTGFLDAAFHPAQPLDWILMLDVLEHMDKPAEALQQAWQLLRPGGRLVVTVPAFMLLWTQHDEWNQHRIRYRRDSLTRLVQNQGFVVKSSRYFFRWVFFAKLLVRFTEWILPGTPGPARVPPGIVNTICRLSSVAEECIYGRMNIPLGTSILLVASRPADSEEREK